jgi:predicted AAA+ superfamily ATPase
VYVQVTKFLIEKNEENSNWEREIGNLESIRDSYEKICICLDNDSQILNSGVKIINVLDWIKNF